MTIAISSVGHLRGRREESFASGGAGTFSQPIISESLVSAKNYFYPSQIMNSRQQQGGQLMNELANGSVSFYITPQNDETWWRCGIGAASSPYSPVGTTTLESMALEVNRVTSDLYVSGAMITSLDFSSSNSDALVCTVGIEAEGFSSGDSTAASFNSSDDPYMHSEGAFVIGGAADNEIIAFSVNVNNNNITDLFTGNRFKRREIPATSTTVTGSITRLFTDNTARTLFFANAQTSFQVTFSRGARSFKILLNKVNFEAHDAQLSGFASAITETIPFTAQVDDVSSDDVIQITVAT
jgi:hypothetical protein